MNVEIGAEAALFPGQEYISGILIAVQPMRKLVLVLMANCCTQCKVCQTYR
jgi:hypothetical protein